MASNMVARKRELVGSVAGTLPVGSAWQNGTLNISETFEGVFKPRR
jgi:hypothetical protein